MNIDAPVIAGVSGGRESYRALDAAAAIAARSASVLVVAHISEHLTPAVALFGGAGLATVTEEEVAEQCRELTSVLLAASPLRWHFERRHGDVVEELLALGRDLEAAMIVVAARPRPRLVELHSIQSRLLHKADRPVLVVPLEDVDAGAECGAGPADRHGH